LFLAASYPIRRRRLRMSSKAGTGIPVYLNVYDLGPMAKAMVNSWSKPLACLGMFHTGIQVLDEEFTFQALRCKVGQDGNPKSGMCKHKPMHLPAHIYRESVWLGFSPLSKNEVAGCILHLAKEFLVVTYDVLLRNCVHFSERLAAELKTTEPFPRWTNDLARNLAWLQPGLTSPFACLESASCNSHASRSPCEEVRGSGASKAKLPASL